MSLLFVAALAAESTQAQASDLVDITGTFANNAALTAYSNPGGTFAAEITLPGDLSYDSSSTYTFNGTSSAFRYSLNGKVPIVVDRPFAFVDTTFTGVTLLNIQDGFRLTSAISTPSFFIGSVDSGGSLVPGTYALTDGSAVTPDTGGVAAITSGTLTISPVPEPSTLALAGSGAALAAAGAFLGRRRQRRLQVGGHQYPAPFIQQTGAPEVRGIPLRGAIRFRSGGISAPSMPTPRLPHRGQRRSGTLPALHPH